MTDTGRFVCKPPRATTRSTAAGEPEPGGRRGPARRPAHRRGAQVRPAAARAAAGAGHAGDDDRRRSRRPRRRARAPDRLAEHRLPALDLAAVRPHRARRHGVRPGEARRGGDARLLRGRRGAPSRSSSPFPSTATAATCELDPFDGAAMAVAECARNIVCVGRRAPRPHRLPQLRQPRECRRPCGASPARSTASPTPAARSTCRSCQRQREPLQRDRRQGRSCRRPRLASSASSKTPIIAWGSAILSERRRDRAPRAPSRGVLGGSEWLVAAQRLGRRARPSASTSTRRPPCSARCSSWLARRLLKSAHDISDGGFAVCLAESCIAHGLRRARYPPLE